MKRYILFFILFSSFSIINAQEDTDSIAKATIKNFHRVDEGIYRSAQPSKKEFKILEEAGFTDILSMRRYHSDDDEAKDISIELHRIKVRAEVINEKHLLKALKTIKNRNGKILIHCHHGSDRTGAVVAMYRIVFQGWSKEKAIDEMKNGDYGFHSIFRNIPKTIEKIDIESFKKKLEEE